VALRAFVKRNARLDGGGTLIAAGSLVAGSITIGSLYGWQLGFATLVVGGGLGKMAFFIRAARQLLRQGFTHADLAPAFDREREQASEELAVGQSRGIRMLERALKLAAIASGVAAVGAVALSLIVPRVYQQLFGLEGLQSLLQLNRWYGSLSRIFVTSVPVGATATLGYLALVQRRRDVDTDLWARLWTGRVGRLAFAIARRSVTAPIPGSAVTHRATELSLGLAAEQLFESLPKETRTALADLPDVLTRLQDDARALRERYGRLQEALAESSDADAPGLDDLRHLRDETQARLADSVAALETIRLNLLRLHAGQSSIEGVTTHLGLAVDVSDQVKRLIEAHAEVERAVFPELGTPTPA
jgi:serine/threonine-protein kinase